MADDEGRAQNQEDEVKGGCQVPEKDVEDRVAGLPLLPVDLALGDTLAYLLLGEPGDVHTTGEIIAL